MEIAQQWFQSKTFSDGVTLLWEPHVQEGTHCNIWHVRGRDRDILVDSGMGMAPLKPAIEALSEREILAVASHTHFDHVGGHHEFEHRLCHPLEAEILSQPDNDKTVWDVYRAYVDDEAILNRLPCVGYHLDDYHIKPAPPTQLIDEGDELDLGDRLFKVFHMPGHSPGSLCLFEERTKTLFTGDVIYDGQLLDSLYHSDKECYLETLARLKEIPAETFHCGHYKSFGREDMLRIVDHYMSQKP